MENTMSLEQSIAANTEALNRLAAAIEAAGFGGTAGSDNGKIVHPVAKSVVADKKPEVDVEKPVEVDVELTYDDVKKPFLRLVNADKEKALGLLNELGLATLKEIEGKPEKYAAVLAAIKKAAGAK
jgi:aminoglycoside/choline kinase family phosphotransferase